MSVVAMGARVCTELQRRVDELRAEAQQAGELIGPSGPWQLEDRSYSRAELERLWWGRNDSTDDVMDAALALKFLPPRPISVLEIGGGEGRLARLLIKQAAVVGASIERYVMVDAVPESIAWAEASMGEYPCVTVIPAWRFHPTPDEFDFAINVASMQEMSQRQIDYYIAAIHRCLRVGGIAFLANSRDYYGRVFAYPPSWRLLLKEPTHRSRTLDYPLEVFEKCAKALNGVNDALDLAYYRAVAARNAATWREWTEKLRAANARNRALMARLDRESPRQWATIALRRAGILGRRTRRANNKASQVIGIR